MSRLGLQLGTSKFKFYLGVIRSDGQWAALHLSRESLICFRNDVSMLSLSIMSYCTLSESATIVLCDAPIDVKHFKPCTVCLYREGY